MLLNTKHLKPKGVSFHFKDRDRNTNKNEMRNLKYKWQYLFLWQMLLWGKTKCKLTPYHWEL